MRDKYKSMINKFSDRELLLQLYMTQIILLTISTILGIILFNSKQEFFALFIWEDVNILFVGGVAGISVVLLDLFLMKLLPKSYYDDGGLNERIFGSRNVFHIAVIALIVAISEELLFRGIIQTHAGLAISSIIFAVIHYRYLFNWFLFLNIIVLSFFIGYLFLLTENLLVTIFMHFIIDFLLGILLRYRNNKQEGMLHE